MSWNFLFIGGTTLLVETYEPAERAKCQGANDAVVFGTVTLTALGAGALFDSIGWFWMNLAAALPMTLVLLSIGAMRLRVWRAVAP